MALHRGQLERLGRAFSLLLLPVAAGCAEDAIDMSQFSEDLCASGNLRALDGVEPAQAVDYVELRGASYYDWGEPESQWSETQVLDASGQVCAGASDKPACESALADLEVESEFVEYWFDGGNWHRSIAYTRGDEVAAATTTAGLLAFLGPIDTAGDAAVLATLQGHTMFCDEDNDAGSRGDSFVLHTQTGGGCGQGDDIYEHVVLVGPDGSIETLESVLVKRGDPGCAAGRLPAGLIRDTGPTRTRSAVGRFFAEVAHLEAAAVLAFEQLTRELRLHGAPASFVASSQHSRQDEVRHAQVTGQLAQRYGGTPDTVRLRRSAPRPFVEVVEDNAAEGCIRETYGALVAHLQARRAKDSKARRALATIARDETRHAALSWDLDGWARARMRPAERRRVERAQRRALDRLQQELTRPEPESVQLLAGMPSPAEAREMFDGLRQTLFA